MITTPDYQALLQTAIAEARQGLAEGGVPIGAALYHNDGRLLGCGHNRRVQEGDPSVHGETDAFRKAGRQRRYQTRSWSPPGTVLVLLWPGAPVQHRHRGGGRIAHLPGGIDWLRENGVNVIDLDNQECVDLLGDFISRHPDIWNEDIGE